MFFSLPSAREAAAPPNSFPARVHAILATDAPVGVVIRRGPSRQVAVLGWDTETDEFRLGQWFSGRIYERRCDISPDGKHFLYFAMNGYWDAETKGSWTAMSRAPFLKAVALWPKGDCWNGGGLFLGGDRFWLNAGCSEGEAVGSVALKRVDEYPWHEGYGGECAGVYYIRLQRTGWVLRKSEPGGGGTVSTFEKPVEAHWKLRKLAYATTHLRPGKGCYFDEHQLVDSRTAEVIECRAWEWAEVDRDRLVWAEQGRIFAGRIGSGGLEAKELFDFNPLRFTRIQAPY